MAEKMLEVRDLKVYFEVKKSLASSLFGKPQVLKAVDGVSFRKNDNRQGHSAACTGNRRKHSLSR